MATAEELLNSISERYTDTLTWDGNTEGRDMISLNEINCYKIYDKYIEPYKMLDGTVELTMEDLDETDGLDNETEVLQYTITSDDIDYDVETDSWMTAKGIIMVSQKAVDKNGLPSVGLYVMYEEDPPETYDGAKRYISTIKASSAIFDTVIDTDEPYIIIDENRKITVPDKLKRIAVQHDHDIETVTFECPRYWDGIDMSAMAIYINYMRADGYGDSYPVKNIRVLENTMLFDWTISRNVTEIKGNITFIVCIKNTNSEGEEVNHWNSELCKDLYVSEGMETKEHALLSYPDLVTQLLLRISTLEDAMSSNDTNVIVDQTYNPESENAQSGKAVAEAIASIPSGGADNKKVINVKNFGAVGDGITNDQKAIRDAFDYALQNLPCEVYFPAGEYGILNGGITVEMPKGSGGLTIRGEGKTLSTIKYLEEWQNYGSWYAIRVCPEGYLDNPPTEVSEYLHDIVIKDLGVYDTDPINHAWHIDKGDPSTEETHGFDIQYCIRATVKDCFISSVGDEAIDIYNCIDVIVAENNVYNSPYAGGAGGAISIGDGTKNAVVSNNTINGSNSQKDNFGIAVESLYIPIYNVVISGNTVSNINGRGINVASTNTGSGVYGLVITDNIISNITGNSIGIGTDGIYSKEIQINGCTISNCRKGIDATNSNTSVYGCTIRDIAETAVDRVMILDGCIIKNVQGQGVFGDGDFTISNCVFDGIALGETKPVGAIQQFSTTAVLEVINTKLYNIQCNKGIHNGTKMINVDVQLAEGIGGDAFSGTLNKYIYGGKINGRITTIQDQGIIDGLTIESTENLWNAPIVLTNKQGIIVTNCHINTISYDAIKESGTSDKNLIYGNVVKQDITVVGANTINANNVVL